MNRINGSFQEYAANSWYIHFIMGEPNNIEVVRRINTLFDINNINWGPWRERFDLNDGLETGEGTNENLVPNPVYYASRLRLTETLRYLIKEGRYDLSEEASSGRNPLGAASIDGNMTVVKMLLEPGSKVTV